MNKLNWINWICVSNDALQNSPLPVLFIFFISNRTSCAHARGVRKQWNIRGVITNEVVSGSNVFDFHFLTFLLLPRLISTLFRADSPSGFPAEWEFFFFCFFLLLPSPFSLPFVLNFQIVPLPLFFSPFPSPLSPSTQPKTAHLWFLFSSLCATQSETLPLSAGQRARIPIRAIDQSPLTPHYPDSVFLSAVHIHTHTHTLHSHFLIHLHMNSCNRTVGHTRLRSRACTSCAAERTETHIHAHTPLVQRHTLCFFSCEPLLINLHFKESPTFSPPPPPLFSRLSFYTSLSFYY